MCALGQCLERPADGPSPMVRAVSITYNAPAGPLLINKIKPVVLVLPDDSST
ncbi:uncharacterized protein PGTG_22520 [Puccinia graminis f. sp. tritici CRL 75-36-700-3]|uniref:Uncharacterized protein n=1 Tax=Puccinia graminis f. sp. tritici (strain CRL 75-36-700-3 / race SCCL) TaxID=418459 RepID=H6QUT3_PUCGT|nr:uncharacterized protein PGTG_22520 [Puccinia graminis f. sp. tritici CRL 75-36-700-3]EHS64841.1 hypothetical protein PGTG_22520 [Puccinia graminis f. sp. tritici CRL 75-36-700-3]